MRGRGGHGLAAGIACAAAIAALAGCGGDDEPEATDPVVTAPTETETTPQETEAETEMEPAETGEEPAETELEEPAETQPGGSPEEQPGGAGDEEPARTLALFTARDGRIRPRLVRVPAFISIQIELRSADGAAYELRFGDAVVSAGGELNSMSVTIDGLRPGKAVTGVPVGAGNRVRVAATAEPGP